jgi:hypothetical protein
MMRSNRFGRKFLGALICENDSHQDFFAPKLAQSWKNLKQQKKQGEQAKKIGAYEEKVNRLAEHNITIDFGVGVKKNYEIFAGVLA